MSYEFDPELEMDEDGEWIDEESYENVNAIDRLIAEAFPRKKPDQKNIGYFTDDGQFILETDEDPFA